MQSREWEEVRKDGRELLVCLNGNQKAKRDWLLNGGEERHILSRRQLESFFMMGYTEFPDEVAFEGALSDFISLFPKEEIERSRKAINHFLRGAVAEYGADGWSFFTCDVVVMGCCMGEYFSVVNRKEI